MDERLKSSFNRNGKHLCFWQCLCYTLPMDYQNYTLVDFLLDEDFFQWVRHPDESSDKFWAAWLEQHPHKRAEVEEARWLILNIRELMQIVNSAENPPAVFKSEIQSHFKDLMVRINKTKDALPGQISQNNEMKGKDNDGKS